jgi:hypothetical protein
MKKEINIGTLQVSQQAFVELKKQKLPATVAFRLMNFSAEYQKLMQSFNASKTALLKEYGEEQDGVWAIDAENTNWDKFKEEYEELLNETVEVDIPEVSIDVIPEISVEHLEQLKWLINEQ